MSACNHALHPHSGPASAERDPCRARKADQARENRLLSIATPVVFLLAWEVAGQIGWLPQRFFPPPSRIARKRPGRWLR